MKKFSDRITKFQLNNGLKVTIYNTPSYHSYNVSLIVHFGAMYEKYKINDEVFSLKKGIAHFLEHKMFDMKDGNITKEFDHYGLDVNAFTSYYDTIYTLYGIGHFTEGLKLLIDLVFTPYFTKENVESEKSVITNEILMYQDDPINGFYLDFMKSMFKNSPLSREIGGTVEDVKEISEDMLDKAYKTFYHPLNMDLVIVGDISSIDLENILNDYMNKYSFEEYKNPAYVLDEEPNDVVKNKSFYESNAVTNSLYYGIKLPKENYNPLKFRYYFAFILNEIFGFDTKWVQNLLNHRLINDDFHYGAEGFPDYPYLFIYSEAFNPEFVAQAIDKRIKSFKKWKLKKKALERSKKMWIGPFMMKNDSNQFLMNHLGRAISNNYELDDIIPTIQNMNISEAYHFLDIIKKSKKNYSIMKKPKKNENYEKKALFSKR